MPVFRGPKSRGSIEELEVDVCSQVDEEENGREEEGEGLSLICSILAEYNFPFVGAEEASFFFPSAQSG